MEAKAEEQHLDADVEVLARKTGRTEDAMEQPMNRFVHSKTEVFQKIEESLSPLCMGEELNDDERDHGVVHTLE